MRHPLPLFFATILSFWISAVGFAGDPAPYDVLPVAGPTLSAPGKIQVIEFFWFGCPHCYTLEPHVVLLERFKPEYIQIVRVPAAWRAEVRFHAQLFYTLRALGRENLHGVVFDTIHRLGNRLYSTNESEAIKQLHAFAKSQGIDEQEFTRAFHSPDVVAQVQRAEALAKQYHVHAVPTIIIGNTYSTHAGKTGGNEAKLIDLILDLAAQEHQRLTKLDRN